MAHANYIWIGKPPTGEHGGQDTLGPKTMRERMPEQSITFWCLKSQQAHYQAVYDGLNIEVLAIEDAILPKDQAVLDFIQLCLKRAEFLEEKLADAIATGDKALQKAIKKDIAREYISIKDIMIYYIQTEHQLVNHSDEECRYYLDTNITLQPDFDKPRLDDLSTFSAPYDHGVYDPWLMISTKTEMGAARRRFDNIFEQYSVDVYQQFGLTEPSAAEIVRHTPMTRYFLSGSYVSSCMDAQGIIMKKTASRARTHVYLDNGLQKFYMNTHKPSDDCDDEPLVVKLAKGTPAIPELKHFLCESSFKPSDIYTVPAASYNGDVMPVRINIFLDLCSIPKDMSEVLAALIDALDDLSILFFNDESIDCEKTPFRNIIERHFRGLSDNELEVLLKKCFERHPELELRCFKLIERLIPDKKISNITELIENFKSQELTYDIIVYTFQSIIPEGEQRDIPDFVIELAQELETAPVTAPVGGGFFATVDQGKPQPIAPGDEHNTESKPG